MLYVYIYIYMCWCCCVLYMLVLYMLVLLCVVYIRDRSHAAGLTFNFLIQEIAHTPRGLRSEYRLDRGGPGFFLAI